MSAKARPGAGINFADLQTPAQAPAPAAAPARSSTVIGFMGAAVAGAKELQADNARLQEQVKTLEGERGAIKLDPALVRPSRWANRHELNFTGPEFAELKTEIEDAGGNVQPIKVRPVATPADGARYEIVFGHRRHRACLELGLQVLAVVADLQDRDLFVEMDRENRGRKNLSAYEQGVMYRRALDEGLFPSQRMLAQAVGVDPGNLSRALRVAELPQEVLEAFGSPLEIQFSWASDLADAVRQDRDGAVTAAREAAGQPPARVFAAITGRAAKRGGVVPYNTPTAPPAAPVQASARPQPVVPYNTAAAPAVPTEGAGERVVPYNTPTACPAAPAQPVVPYNAAALPAAPSEGTRAGVVPYNTPVVALEDDFGHVLSAAETELGTVVMEFTARRLSGNRMHLTAREAARLGAFLLEHARRHGWEPDPAD